MKEIRAYIQPHVLDRLVEAFDEIPDFPGMSLSDCQGFGRERIEAGRGFTQFATKKRLEIFAPDELAETIVATIMKHAHTGRAGDGRLYVTEVLAWGKIRTGKRGGEVV
ncbi:P-II family nitrogen regulator [Methylomagnum sp.]